MTLPILTNKLSYAPRGGVEDSESIFEPQTTLRLSDESTSYAVDPIVFKLIKDGVLVITSSISSKRIFAGVRYVIAKQVETGLSVKDFQLSSLEEVKGLLLEGWKICKKTVRLGYVDMLVPNDSEHLIAEIDMRMRWRDTLCAVINCEIEGDANWSTGGVFAQAARDCVKNEEVVVNECINGFEKGERLSASEFVVASVLRGLEPHLNEVFAFVRQDPNAFYLATPSAQGINVGRYADVRALLWHKRDQEERDAREQAIEDGLAV